MIIYIIYIYIYQFACKAFGHKRVPRGRFYTKNFERRQDHASFSFGLETVVLSSKRPLQLLASRVGKKDQLFQLCVFF